MVVLDTNVLSELIRPRPDPGVVEWIDQQNASEVRITAITAAELRAGVAVLPAGRRKSDLHLHIEALLDETFAGAVLAFDAQSANPYAEIVSARRNRGRPIAFQDAQIGAICLQHQMTLATRNTRGFADTGVDLIDPWSV
jgi:predicted nucleic acid-binding protein